MTASLQDLRTKIDDIDDRILKLIAARRDTVRKVGSNKKDGDIPVRNSAREVEVLDRLIAAGRQRGLSSVVVTDAFRAIIRDSVELQRTAAQHATMSEAPSHPPLEVAFQGGEASYSDQGARRFFSEWPNEVTFAGMTRFADVVDAVTLGSVDYGLLPIENTTAGSITEVQDLLLESKLRVVGETVVRVDHCLIGLAARPLTELRRAISHPQALAQCSQFLAALPNCRQEAFADTALAVARVRDQGDSTQVAIASAEAARRYGLEILETGINNQQENFTRFLVLSNRPHPVDLKLDGKTALFVGTDDRSGALLSALSVLHRYGINLTKLESRPRPGSPFEYSFYLELDGLIGEDHVDNALDELRSATRFLKLLGSFPRWDQAPSAPSAHVLANSREPARPREPVGRPNRSTSRCGKLFNRDRKPAGSIVSIGPVEFGGMEFPVIAGPQVVESEKQIQTIASLVREYGGKVLKGGCFPVPGSKPTSRYLGLEGVELLSAAGANYGLPIVTEVSTPEHVARVSGLVDAICIGAHNMQNFDLLKEVGAIDIPIILERDWSASIEDLLNSADNVLGEGNQRVILCERSSRTFENRQTLDLANIALLREQSHLPIVVDPCGATEQPELVSPLALAARTVGAAGMSATLHPFPNSGESKLSTALDEELYGELMSQLARTREAPNSEFRNPAGASASAAHDAPQA